MKPLVYTYQFIHLNVYATKMNKLGTNEQAHQAQRLCSQIKNPDHNSQGSTTLETLEYDNL